MALLKGEGTHQILYGGADIFSGLRHNRGYLARPDHAGEFPTVLLVHGADGITASVKSVARRLARHGVAVVGPDLYRGRVARPPGPTWPDPRSVAADLGDAVMWMASPDTPWVRPGRIGLLAFDRAAIPALLFAAGREVAGSIALVSPVLDEEIPLSSLPGLAFTGKDDSALPVERREAARTRISGVEWVLYGGVGHGLLDEAADDYRWDVAEDVIARTVSFFSRLQSN
jgi:dienelactone hydrolase